MTDVFSNPEIVTVDRVVPAASPLSKRELFTFAFRYWKRLLLSFLLTFLVMLGVAFLPTPVYHGDAVVIVRLGPEFTYQPVVDPANQQATVLPFSSDEIFQSEVAILKSDQLHAEVVKSVGVGRLFPQMVKPGPLGALKQRIAAAIHDRLVAWGQARRASPDEIRKSREAAAVVAFDSDLSVFLAKDSAVITVAYQNPDPAVTAEAINTLLRLYMASRREVYLEHRANVASTELQEGQRQLLFAERALNAFVNRQGIIQFNEQRDALLGRRDAAAVALAGFAADEASDAKTIAALSLGATDAGPDVTQFRETGMDSAMSRNRTRVADAEAKLKSDLIRYARDSPIVTIARKELAAARQVAADARQYESVETRFGRNPTYDALDLERKKMVAQLDAVRARKQIVQGQLQQLDGDLRRLSSLEQEYNNLTQDVALARDRVGDLSRKVDLARALDDQDKNRADAVRIIQSAVVSPYPTTQRRLIAAGGFLLALLVTLLVAAATEFMRGGFLTPEEMERKLGLRVIGSVAFREPDPVYLDQS